jgi:GNAT superfamily N-acetyltransferase
MAVHIRSDLRPGDLGRVLYVHGAHYRPVHGWDQTFEGYVAAGLAEFALGYDPRKDRLWLAEADGEVVGCIAIAGHGDGQAQLRWFLVLPPCQGRGLGRRLLEEALGFCRECAFRSVFLWTVAGLPAAAHLYESAGFRAVEEKTHELWGAMLTEVRYELTL